MGNSKPKIIKKKYARICFTLASSLSVGSGRNDYTDHDIIRDSQGHPYIPASSLAGVYESMLPAILVSQYFGNTGKQGEYENSRLMVYNAKLEDTRLYHTNRRDMVKLDSCKTAVPGAKFDREILEPGVKMVMYLEQNYYDENDVDVISEIIDLWIDNKLFFGAKTMRGFGEVNLESIGTKEFCLNSADDVCRWLGFDMLTSEYDDCEFEVQGKTNPLELNLLISPVGGLSIRQYTTEVSTEEETVPDYKQLSVKKGDAQIPIVPGTSWAGALKARLEQLAPELCCSLGPDDCQYKDKCRNDCFPKSEWDWLFGFVHNGKGRKSSVRTNETQIEKAKDKVLTRNAIDRFTGGTVKGALFTERASYGGTTNLCITFREKPDATLIPAIAAAIADLHYGFLAVGGQTAVGRGLFRVKNVNGKDVPFQEDDPFAFSENENIFTITKQALEKLGNPQSMEEKQCV